MRRLIASTSLSLLVAQAALAAASVSSVATGQAASLPLDGAGVPLQRIIKVADLHITADSAAGFTLTVTSGELSKPDGQTPIPFQVITVAAGAPPPTAASFDAAPGEVHVFRSVSPGNFTRELYVRYTAAARQDPGTYLQAVGVNVVDN